MAFVVQAHTDDHTLSATTETATDAFAKAVEWQAVHKFTGVTISDGVRTFTIAEFASAMATLEIANTLDAATDQKPKVRMMKPYPTYRQREVLQFLMQGDWVPLLRMIAVGDRLLGNLVQAGWIERSPDFTTSDLYRITEAGRAAYRAPVPVR